MELLFTLIKPHKPLYKRLNKWYKQKMTEQPLNIDTSGEWLDSEISTDGARCPYCFHLHDGNLERFKMKLGEIPQGIIIKRHKCDNCGKHFKCTKSMKTVWKTECE
jgi:hypothetical protein